MREDIVQLVRIYETLRCAYFWKPPATALRRREMEESFSIGPIEWEDAGHKYSAEIYTRVSANHVYVYKVFNKDGERTNWTAIRNSIERMLTEEMG